MSFAGAQRSERITFNSFAIRENDECDRKLTPPSAYIPLESKLNWLVNDEAENKVAFLVMYV